MNRNTTTRRQRNRRTRQNQQWQSGYQHQLRFEKLEDRRLLNADPTIGWEPPAALTFDSLSNDDPQLATDSAGNWISVWRTFGDNDIRFSRSMDNGQTWSEATLLSVASTSNSPQITTDSLGTWITVWDSSNTLDHTIGTDSDILFSRSTDVGQTWSDPLPLNSTAATDSSNDIFPQLTTDSAGNWITVWQTNNTGGPLGSDSDILFARSTDGGLSWSPPEPLNHNATSDSGDDTEPQLTTDSAGTWIAVWQSTDTLNDTIGDDQDILFSRSMNNGQTWTPASPLNAYAATDGVAADWRPQLTTDSRGNWIALWEFDDEPSGTLANHDIVISHSTDAGQTWTVPAALTTDDAGDLEGGWRPQLSTDSMGNWVAVWYRYNFVDDIETDIMYSHSTDVGESWSEPAPLNTDAQTDSSSDYFPQVAVDCTGTWITVWKKYGSDGSSSAILFSRGAVHDTTLLFADSFEHGQWNNLWVEDRQNDWFTSTQRSTDGNYAAEVDGRATDATITVAAPLNLTPYDSAELTFDWLIESGLDSGEYLALDFFNGAGWQEVAKLSGNVDTENIWHEGAKTVDGEYLVNNFQFRFRAKMSGSDEDANVDNVRLVGRTSESNTPPIATHDAYTVNEDTTLVVTAAGVLANDSDADGDALTARLVTNVSSGSLEWNADGLFNYTPALDFYGTDSFSYRVCDGSDYSETAMVEITVNKDETSNHLPTAIPQTITLDEDTSRPITLSGTDPDDDPLTYHIVDPPQNGTLSGAAPNLIYTPHADYYGPDSFTFLVNDTTDNSQPATVSLTVLSVHDYPQLDFTMYVGGTNRETIYGMDVTADGYTFVTGYTSSVDLPNTVQGSVYGGGSYDGFVTKVDNTGAIVWSTYLGGSGSDYGRGIAIDGSGDLLVAGYTGSDDLASGYAGGSYDGFVAKINGTTGSVERFTYVGGTGSEYVCGIAVDDTGNVFVAGYTDSQDLPNRTNSFLGGTRDTFVASINTLGDVVWTTYLGGSGNDYAAANSAIAIDSSQNVFVAGYTNSTDLAGSINEYQGGLEDSFVAKVSSGGTVAWTMYLGGTNVEYARGITVDGTDNVLVTGHTRSDDLPNATNVNHGGYDGYVARIDGVGSVQWTTYLGDSDDDYAQDVTTNGSGDVFVTGYSSSEPIGGRDALLAQLDRDTGDLDWMTYFGGTEDDYGQSVATDGQGYVYAAGYTWSNDIPGALNVLQGDRDGILIKLDPATLAPPVGEPPVASDDSYSVDEDDTLTIAVPGVLDNDSDADGDSLTAVLVSSTANGTLNLDVNGSFTYSPNTNFNGADSFTYQAYDGANYSEPAIVSITINAVNDVPTITSSPITSATEGEAYSYDVEASDPDVGDTLTYSLVTAPTGMSIDAVTGLISWTPGQGDAGEHPVEVNVEDTERLSDTQSFTIGVNQPNYAPTIMTIEDQSTAEDQAYSCDVVATDPNEGDPLMFSLDEAPAGMTIDVDAGRIEWTPDNDDVGVHSVTVRVEDQLGAFDTESFTLTVTNVNDAPTIKSTPVTSATAGEAYAYDVNASDPDVGDSLTFSLETTFAGMAIDAGSGLISWTPTDDQVGDNVVTVLVTDNGSPVASDTQSFTITVSAAVTGPNLSHGTIASVGSGWQTVSLDTSYASMVVVATPRYNSGSGPGVVRINNVRNNSFDVRVDNVGSISFSGGVHYVAVEEGVYDTEGYKLEAVKYSEAQTSRKGSWDIDMVGYQQSYSSPVVVGQVMSFNDNDWSVFWASSDSRTSPPSSSQLNVGKHVGEDPDPARASETIGYLVIEATQSGVIDGLPFVAGVGSDSIRGVQDGTYQYNYNAMEYAKTVVLSNAGMDGGDGGWAVLRGTNPLPPSGGTISLSIDEDQLYDSERNHTTEQVAYFVIDPPLPADLPAANSLDVNCDGLITSMDALSIINRLHDRQFDDAPQRWDTNGDQQVTPLDALLVINHLHHQATNAAHSSEDRAEITSRAVDEAWASSDDLEDDLLDDELLETLI